jgi:hypothetical protein
MFFIHPLSLSNYFYFVGQLPDNPIYPFLAPTPDIIPYFALANWIVKFLDCLFGP